MKAAFRRFRDKYVHFVEKQGFPIIVTVCVAVITATALWTGQREEAWAAPTPPVLNDVSAAQLQQQRLRDASTATPAPTAATPLFSAPLAEYSVLRAFDADHMVQSGVTGIWAIHDAVDLKAESGSKVYAMADGVVLAHGEDKLQGAWLTIDHGKGVEALYAGMAVAGAYITGDAVRGGDVIGFVGSGTLAESDLESHLHLRVTKDSAAVDPVALWQIRE